MALSDAEVSAALGTADSDLLWLFGEHTVSDQVQARIIRTPITKVRLFIGLGETRPEVKEVLKRHYDLDAAESCHKLKEVAAVLSAWDAARAYVSRDDTLRAESKASDNTLPVAALEHRAMKAAFEKVWGPRGGLPDEETPNRHYLGLKTNEIEAGELIAESLSQVCSKLDGEEDYLGSDICPRTGHIRVKKGAKVVHGTRKPRGA